MNWETYVPILLAVIFFTLGLKGSIALCCEIFFSYLGGYSARHMPELGKLNYVMLLLGVFFIVFGIHALASWLIGSWFAYPLTIIVSITLGVVIACRGYLDSNFK